MVSSGGYKMHIIQLLLKSSWACNEHYLVRNSTHTSLEKVLTLEHNTGFSWFPMLPDKSVPYHVGFGACPFREAKYPFHFPADFSAWAMGFPYKGGNKVAKSIFPSFQLIHSSHLHIPLTCGISHTSSHHPGIRDWRTSARRKGGKTLAFLRLQELLLPSSDTFLFVSYIQTTKKLNSSRNTAFISNHCIHNEYGTRFWRTPVRQTTLNEYSNTKADECNQLIS